MGAQEISLEFFCSKFLALRMIPGRQQSPWQGWSLCLLLLPLVLVNATEGASLFKEKDVGPSNNDTALTTANVTSTATTQAAYSSSTKATSASTTSSTSTTTSTTKPTNTSTTTTTTLA